MKKQTLRYKFSLISVILILATLLMISCSLRGAGDKSEIAGDYDNSYNSTGGSNGLGDTPSKDNGGIGSIPTGGIDDPNAKIIKTANTRLTTLEFDKFITDLYAKITEMNGYTDSESFSGSAPYRYANITARIPSEKLDELKTHLSSNANLTYYNATKDDVTVTYASLKSELETLKEKRDAISALLDDAKTLSEIQSLTSERYEIDASINKIQSQLDVYDEKIAYSTVHITVNEIKEYVEPQPEEKKGAFVRIRENLGNNLKDIGNFFVEFFVWFTSSIPYFIIFGAVGTGIAFVMIKIKKVKNAKKSTDKKSNSDNADIENKSENQDTTKDENE